jgi:hypothetical protein
VCGAAGREPQLDAFRPSKAPSDCQCQKAGSQTSMFAGARRQEAEAQQQCAQRLAGVIEWLDAQADAEGPFFLGKQARVPGFRVCGRLPDDKISTFIDVYSRKAMPTCELPPRICQTGRCGPGCGRPWPAQGCHYQHSAVT